MNDRKQYYLSKKVELLDRAIFNPYALERTRALNACKVIDQILETINQDSRLVEQEKRIAAVFKDMKDAI